MFAFLLSLYFDIEKLCLSIYRSIQQSDLTRTSELERLCLYIFITVMIFLFYRWVRYVTNYLHVYVDMFNGDKTFNSAELFSKTSVCFMFAFLSLFIINIYVSYVLPKNRDVDDYAVDFFDFVDLGDFGDFVDFGDVGDFGDLDRGGQNVHDSLVTKYTINAIKKLGELESPTSKIFKDVVNYVRTSTDPKAPQALLTLNTISETNGFHAATKKTETEIVGLVWQRIHHPVNHKHVDDLHQMLIQELADGYNVCLVGRISRILQTLESIDAENIVNLHPQWAVSEEINHYCAKYVKKLTEKLPTAYKEAIDVLNRTPEQEMLANRFYRCVKNNLQRKFKQLYLDTQIITKEKLDRLTSVPFEQFTV